MRHRPFNDSRHDIRRAPHLTPRRTACLLLFAATLIVLPFNTGADYITVKPENLDAKFGSSVTFNKTANVYTISATEGSGVEILFRERGNALTFNINYDARQKSLVFVRSTADRALRCVLEILCTPPHAPSSAPAPDTCEVYLWNSSHHVPVKTSNTSFAVNVTTTNITVADAYAQAYGDTCLLLPEDNSTGAVVWNLDFFTEKVANGTEYSPLPIQVNCPVADIVERVQNPSIGGWPTAKNILYIVSPPFLPPSVFLVYVGLTALLLLTLAAINIWATYRHCVKMRREKEANRIIKIFEHDRDEVGKVTKEYTTRGDEETQANEDKSRKDQVTKREHTRESKALPAILRTEATRESTAHRAPQSVYMNAKQ